MASFDLPPETLAALEQLAQADGTTLEASHDSGIPWADVAKQRRALETKFDSLVTPILGAGGARRLHDAIERVDSLADVGELARASTK